MTSDLPLSWVYFLVNMKDLNRHIKVTLKTLNHLICSWSPMTTVRSCERSTINRYLSSSIHNQYFKASNTGKLFSFEAFTGKFIDKEWSNLPSFDHRNQMKHKPHLYDTAINTNHNAGYHYGYYVVSTEKKEIFFIFLVFVMNFL